MSEKNESLLEKEDRDDEVEKVRSLGARFRIPPKSRVFVVTVFVQFLLVFAFTIQYLVALSRTSSSSPDPVDPSPPSPSNADNHSIAIFFTLNVLFSALILLYFAIDAAVDENEYQLFSFVLVSLLVLLRVVYSFVAANTLKSHKRAYDPHVVLAGFAIEIIFEGVTCLFAYHLYKSFGWKIFKTVGTDALLVEMFRFYQQFVSVLKLDVQFSVMSAFMQLFFFTFYKDYSQIATWIWIVLTCLLSYLLLRKVREENTGYVFAFVAFSLLMPIYAIYQVTIMYAHPRDTFRNYHNIEQDEGVSLIQGVVASTAGLAFVLRIYLIFLLAKLVRKVFGRGLKERVHQKQGDTFT